MRNKKTPAEDRDGSLDGGDKERLNLYVAPETAQRLKHCAVDEALRVSHLAEALIELALRDPAVLAKAVVAAKAAKKRG
jgi:hypothetical protein